MKSVRRADFGLRLWLICAFLGVAPLGRAQTNLSGLLVTGAVAHPLKISLSELKEMPRVKLGVREKNGNHADFEGVPLADIIKRASPALDKQCCSNAANAVVVVRAADGYRALFSLSEIDPDLAGRQILVADQRNGEAVGPAMGPLRLVAPEDKAYSRWVRQAIGIEIQVVGSLTNAVGH